MITDVNECVHENGGCDLDATCVNTDGSMRCVCDDGFEGDGYQCTDIDECAQDSRLCEHGVCLNFAGGYRCQCDMGYTTEDKQRRCVGES